MGPGRELDVLIAERVMGDDLSFRPADRLEDGIKPGAIFYDVQPEPRPYSTDIACAWEVVEKFTDLCFSLSKVGDEWECELDSNDGKFLQNGPTVHVFGSGETAPHAICLAALKAVGVGL